MEKLTLCLWFDGRAEEAMNFYTSVFDDAKTGSVSRYGDGGPAPAGSVMVATFEINGQKIMALNGGPMYQFTPAISIVVTCQTQEEIDNYWDKLSAGGATNRCGWLTDKFGVSWQVVPANMGKLMQNPDPAKAANIMSAMMKMEKLDIKALEDAGK